MTDIPIKLIWEQLHLKKQQFVTREQLQALAQRAGKNYRVVSKYLSDHGYIKRVFNGLYYVRSLDERARDVNDISTFELVGRGLECKGITNWFFGLETALKMNQMTHEYYTLNYVITDSYRTTKIVRIIDSDFQFIQWSKALFSFGIVRQKKLKYSDPERTLIDLVYHGLNNDRPDGSFSTYDEYVSQLDRSKIEDYLTNYPMNIKKVVWKRYEGLL